MPGGGIARWAMTTADTTFNLPSGTTVQDYIAQVDLTGTGLDKKSLIMTCRVTKSLN